MNAPSPPPPIRQVSDVNGLVERLLMFLESGYDHIVAETLIQLRDLLRRYPDLGEVGQQLHQPGRVCRHDSCW